MLQLGELPLSNHKVEIKMRHLSEKEIGLELIQLGIERLKRLGFDHVTEENIQNDKIYTPYFHQLLTDMMGESIEKDRVIKKILKLE